MKSIYSTQALIDLVESSLISTQEFNEIYQQTHNLRDDNKIEKVIEKWLKSPSHQGIFEAYKQRLTEIIASSSKDLNKNLGGFGSESSTKANQPSQTSRELLDNAIARTNPSSASPPANP